MNISKMLAQAMQETRRWHSVSTVSGHHRDKAVVISTGGEGLR